jgi:hypothetical protein
MDRKEAAAVPKIQKALRREKQRRKAIDSKYQNVRYQTGRAGEGLLRREVERNTRLKPERKS